MRRWNFGVVVCTAVISLLFAHARPASAQTRPDSTVRDTTPKTPSEKVRDKLRTMRPIGAPDSVLNGDSLRAQPQQIQINGMMGSGGNSGGNGRNIGRGNDRGNTAQSAPIVRDSIWESLLTLPGFNITEYKGDTATFRADSSNLWLQGNALVSRDGQLVEAGRITYADSISLVCGYGKPRVSGAGTATPLESDSLCYDIAKRYGVARGATTSISDNALWRMYSTQLVTRGDDYYSNGAVFTDCDLPWDEVHYAFTAKQVLAKRNNVLVARDVTLRFKDVPVFWLPFMVQSLSQGRRSGVLMPRFGVNDIARSSSRYSRRIEDVGFYWAMNDFMGSEVAFDWMSDNWTALRGSFDYNFLQQFIRGGLTARRFWKNEGGSELTIASQNSWEPNERTRLQANVNYATSSRFVQSRTYDPRELNRSIDSNFSMNRRLNFGSLTLGATRRQFLNDNTVNQTLPNASMQLSPITLFRADPGSEHWFSNSTWTASASTRREENIIDETRSTNPSAQTRRQNGSQFQSSFALGKLSLRQNFSIDGQRTDARMVPLSTGDSVVSLAAARSRRNAWDVGVDYQQRLIGTTTFTPSLRLSGEALSNDKTLNKTIAAPVRMNFGAGLQANAYGIFNFGVGPFEKFRHKVSPSFSYTYSPKPTADSLQTAVFSGLGNTLEQNSLSFNLTQTFEAKYREKRDSATIAEESASAANDSGPKRMAGVKTVSLLSISTSGVAYDFVQAREFGTGIQGAQLTNDLHSDLLQGLTVGLTHDLFRTITPADGSAPTVRDRKFEPHLSNASASFQISGQSWLFRILGLGRRDSISTRPGTIGSPVNLPAEGGTPVDRNQSEFGLVGTRNRFTQSPMTGSVGSWTADLRYSLQRPRSTGAILPSNSLYRNISEGQTLNGTLNFQPTENWSASWVTTYSITRSQFADHALTLTRKLHDWDAHFDFIKAQNGNFSFNFRVNLRANPDIKLDWSQNEKNNNFPSTRF